MNQSASHTAAHSAPMTAATADEAVDRLPSGSVFRSLAGRQEYVEFYNGVLSRLAMPLSSKSVSTSFGKTHINFGGKPDGKPVLVLPGMSISSPLMLEFFDYMAEDHLMIAPDLIGQPGLSEDRKFSPDDHNYGRWLAEVMDALGIGRIDMLGSSFGGSIALDLATFAPERVGKLGLVVTAGLTPNIPKARIFGALFFTWMAYRYLPIPGAKKILPSLARPLARVWPQNNLDYLDVVIRQTAFWRHRPAGPFVDTDFKSSLEPVFITFSRHDIMFPYKQTYPLAQRVLPIAEEITLEDSAHMPSPYEMEPVHKAIRRYFAG
ncbi:alpha/beta fold hydrolase [Cucumibacter marinus]|uniref:alpha/beta fold hydrolase n=1 Tax=Cucumibacter marinus TaxID=1121252 RepID=UPI00041EDF0E|nr:alpha/beta hydrolase [Cucumibacter marinus]